MQMRLTKLLSGLILTAASSVLASAATAQTDPSGYQPIRLEPLPEVIERAFYNESGDFYESTSIEGQINFLIGPGLPGGGGAAFPDLEIERDARLINTIYNDALEAQASSDPVLRTPDLPNPYDTSIRQLPVSRRYGGRVEGSEFFLDAPQLR